MYFGIFCSKYQLKSSSVFSENMGHSIAVKKYKKNDLKITLDNDPFFRKKGQFSLTNSALAKKRTSHKKN